MDDDGTGLSLSQPDSSSRGEDGVTSVSLSQQTSNETLEHQEFEDIEEFDD